MLRCSLGLLKKALAIRGLAGPIAAALAAMLFTAAIVSAKDIV